MLQQIPLFNMFGLRDSGAVKVGRHLTFNSRAETGTKAENDGAAAGAGREERRRARQGPGVTSGHFAVILRRHLTPAQAQLATAARTPDVLTTLQDQDMWECVHKKLISKCYRYPDIQCIIHIILPDTFHKTLNSCW